MRLSAKLIVISLLVVAVAGAIFWMSAGTHSVQGVSAHFIGYTNDASGVRVAAFEVHNRGHLPIKRWATYRCATNGLQTAPFASLRYSSTVNVDGAERILMPTPSVGSPWKVTFTCSTDGWRPRIYIWLENAGWSGLASRVANSFPVESVESDWVRR